MPVQIGEKAHNFTDPTGLLSDCHRRIEMFMRVLEGVAKLVDSPLDEETRQLLTTALGYFRNAAPKHTADEEESLFPRLRLLRSLEIEAAVSKLDELESEHCWAEPLHARVDELGQEYLLRGRLSAEQIDEFRSGVAQLSAMYEHHISIEDGTLFPVARKVLSDRDKQVIAEEMAKRRAVPLVHLPDGQGS